MTILIKAFISLLILFISAPAYSAPAISKWVSLDSDLKDRIRRIIRSEVENREGFSIHEDEILNTRMVEEERQKENSVYKSAIDSANREFARSKKRRDDLTAQFQTAAYDFEEFQKNVKTMRSGIDNIDNQIARYEQDIKTQQDSLKKWLQTEKQGEAIVAVIYTRGFRDKEHDLESLADQSSVATMVQYMGTYIKSFTRVIDNLLSVDFIRAIEEGTAKWNNEEPMRVELEKGSRGTTYLRIKRYELYPFQSPKTGRSRVSAEARKLKTVVLKSVKDLESFLAQSGYQSRNYELGRADVMVRESAQNSSQAEEALSEQVHSFRERIGAIQEKLVSVSSDRDLQVTQLSRKEVQLAKIHADLDDLKGRRDSAEKAFHDSQNVLDKIKRRHESIIIKTSLATTRGSQTPAEASAEAVIDKLEEVRNDARLQHSSSTTDVMNFQVVGQSQSQTITEARIIGVRLISLINEGDSVRVKMAFRVRTEMEERKKEKETESPAGEVLATASSDEPSLRRIDREPVPRPVVTKVPPPEDVRIANLPLPEPVKSAAIPKSASPTIASAETDEFLFELKAVKVSGGDLYLFIDATNKMENVRYLAVYDQSSRYTKSTLIDETGKTHEVEEVYLWEGKRRTRSYDASRGVPVEHGQSVTVEMIFKGVPPANREIKLLNLHPYAASRVVFVFKWRDVELQFKDILVRK